MRSEEIKNLVYKFQDLGLEKFENGTILIGKAPFIGENAWLNKIYEKLNDEDIGSLQTSLKSELPFEYVQFLKEFSNGLNILSSTFCLYGLRKQIGRTLEASRQPFSLSTPNLYERPRNAKENYFFIGGYNWDGSHLYIDKQTNIVHYCKRNDATSLFQWSSFEVMLLSEIIRIYKLFDESGKELDDEVSTTPV